MIRTRAYPRKARRIALRRTMAALLLTMVGGLFAVPPAEAAVALQITAGGVLTYTGSDVARTLTISVTGGVYTFNDSGETITVGGAGSGGCTGGGTNTVTCPSLAISQ